MFLLFEASTQATVHVSHLDEVTVALQQATELIRATFQAFVSRDDSKVVQDTRKMASTMPNKTSHRPHHPLH